MHTPDLTLAEKVDKAKLVLEMREEGGCHSEGTKNKNASILICTFYW